MITMARFSGSVRYQNDYVVAASRQYQQPDCQYRSTVSSDLQPGGSL